MAGNAKEWCWNEAGQGKRYILGGAWREPEYMFWVVDSRLPFDRSPTDGFRCMTLLSTNPLPKGVDDRVLAAYRDYANELPVSDEVFRSYKSFFSYDKTDLAWQIEAVDDSSEFWREEKVSFSAAYGNERVTAFLFLPKKFAPPYQAVVYFPGSHAIFERSSMNIQRWRIEFIVESGRAVMYPIYKSTYKRGDGLPSDRPSPTSAYRDHVVMWSKDLGRALDYLETRHEIRHDKVAYYGVSWGAVLGVVLPAVESRLKANGLVAGGFLPEAAPAEVDQINFAPRVTIPTLMLNGRYDSIFPLETSQLPMFRMLGTAPEHKRHVILNSGHVPPSTQLAKEILPWLDQYLGPVN